MLGRAVLRAARVLALCALLSTPLAATAQQCGNWQGNTTSWLCTSSAPCAAPSQCGVLVPPVNGVVPDCVCTTCALDATGQGCTGRCQYGHSCAFVAGDAVVPPSCACAAGTPQPPAPTPAPAPTSCGKWRGLPPPINGVPVVPTANDYICDAPQCTTDPTQLCAITTPPSSDPAAPPPQCECTTCAINPATQLCAGVCQVGATCSRVAGTTRCVCEDTPPPPPPPCGHYAGAKTWLCDKPDCPGVQVGTNVDGLPIVQPRQCGVLVKPVSGAVAECGCTTCHYNAEAGACVGKCQLSYACGRTKNDPPGVCRCLRKTHVIVVVVIVIGVVLTLVLILASMFTSSSTPVRRASSRR